MKQILMWLFLASGRKMLRLDRPDISEIAVADFVFHEDRAEAIEEILVLGLDIPVVVVAESPVDVAVKVMRASAVDFLGLKKMLMRNILDPGEKR